MEYIYDAVPLVKLLLVFAIVIVLQHTVLSIGTAFLAGVIVLELWFPVPAAAFFRTVTASVFSLQTVSLVLLIILIVSLSHALKISGHFQKIVDAIREFISSERTSLFIFPALIGLLPMPGGAIFSAPMVEEIARSSGLSPARQAAANHWFRHVWEYIWPLYPGILLASQVTGIALLSYICVNAPFTLAAIAAGFVFVVRGARFPAGRFRRPSPASRRLSVLLRALFPILVIIGGFAAFRLLLAGGTMLFKKSVWPLLATLPGASAVPFSPPAYAEKIILILSIAAGLAFPLLEYRAVTVKNVFADKRLPSLVLMIIGLLLFQDVLRAGPLVPRLMASFGNWHVPVWALAALFPFITGLVTGITVGFVACSFPILTEVISYAGLQHYMLPLMVLAFVCGFMGVMISPLHVCLILTAKHFNVSIARVLAFLLVPVGCVLAAACLVSLFLWKVVTPFLS